MRIGTGFLVLLVLAGAGWKYRVELRSLLDETRSAASAPVPTTELYRWVDDKGVTHYEQRAGKGRPVKVDGSGITPIEPLGPGGFQSAPDPARKSDQGLLRLREELEAGALQLQEGRIAAGL